MEPLSILAGVATTYIVPKALEKIGEKVGESALAKSANLVQATCKLVTAKLEASKTEGVLAIAQSDPTPTNLQLLETVLMTQMKADPNFTAQLQGLINQIQSQTPTLQIVLDTVRIRGNVELGNIEQMSETASTEQIIGRNLGVGGDLKIGDITQKAQRKE